MKCIDSNFKKKIENYLKEEPEENLRDEIIALFNDKNSKEELFHRMDQFLHFGTAGLRAPMRAGYNALNLVTVYRFAYALASHIQHIPTCSVAIGFDARIHSEKFAHEVAKVLSCFKIATHVFEKCVPTPICAFATKYLSANFGVMITASHNPGSDNGIKLYSSSSAQMHGELLSLIENAMKEAPLRNQFFAQSAKDILPIKTISFDVINAYFQALSSTQLIDDASIDTSFSLVYTPLHGVGRDYALRAFNERGFKDIHVVAEQSEPDGNFPTTPFPNPEEEHVLDCAYERANQINCDWVFANDPDADRLQVSYRDKNGKFRKLTGNEMGAILGYFSIKRALDENKKPLVASSIVSSRMLEKIAFSMKIDYKDGLTGFSNIISQAQKLESQSGGELVFAYEEAIGFLIGKVVLDKDGVNAAVRFAEIFSYLQKEKISINQFLDSLYSRFGLFLNQQWSYRFIGNDADRDMTECMKKFRALPNSEMTRHFNEQDCQKYDLLEIQKEGPYAGMSANVVIFEIKDKGRLIVRPSGTEPKIKFYVEVMDGSDTVALEDKKSLLSKKLCQLRSSIEKILA